MKTVTKEIFQDICTRDVEKLSLQDRKWLMEWECAPEYHSFQGYEGILEWFQWQRVDKNFLPHEMVEPLAQLSQKRNTEIVSRAFPDTAYTFAHVDHYNASDFIFQNFYPLPERMRVRKVLDFGAGYGRQLNLWSQKVSDLNYVAVEGIERSYCLQNFYYSHFELPLNEYMIDPDDFSVTEAHGVFHLPTWRTDLIPDNHFDLILCVQVLLEINNDLVSHMIQEFDRVIRPGGAIYIRDHAHHWDACNDVDIPAELLSRGFQLEFSPPYRDTRDPQVQSGKQEADLHGLPRIWRKL